MLSSNNITRTVYDILLLERLGCIQQFLTSVLFSVCEYVFQHECFHLMKMFFYFYDIKLSWKICGNFLKDVSILNSCYKLQQVLKAISIVNGSDKQYSSSILDNCLPTKDKLDLVNDQTFT